jgi:ketosteroid isomerase-like protein
MSEADREIALEAYTAATARPTPDFETVNRLFDPDHVLVPLTAQVDSREVRGAAGFRDFSDMRDWEGEIEGAVDIGRGRVLLVTQGHYRGSASGASVPLRSWIVATLRSGKVLRTEIYRDPAQALEVGLAE